MNRLEKLKNELRKIELDLEKLHNKKMEVEDKVRLEEQKEIEKIMKENHLTFDELKKIILEKNSKV